jgi:hypothetical protein
MYSCLLVVHSLLNNECLLLRFIPNPRPGKLPAEEPPKQFEKKS